MKPTNSAVSRTGGRGRTAPTTPTRHPFWLTATPVHFFFFTARIFFFKLFHWICNLFRINAAEPENRGRPNAFLSATSRTGGCVIQHTDTVRRISNSPTLPLLRSVGCSLNAQHIGFWVRDDRTKRSAANSRNLNAEIRAIFRLPRRFAAEPSTGSSWTQKNFDRAWKELSTGVQLTGTEMQMSRVNRRKVGPTNGKWLDTSWSEPVSSGCPESSGQLKAFWFEFIHPLRGRGEWLLTPVVTVRLHLSRSSAGAASLCTPRAQIAFVKAVIFLIWGKNSWATSLGLVKESSSRRPVVSFDSSFVCTDTAQ